MAIVRFLECLRDPKAWLFFFIAAIAYVYTLSLSSLCSHSGPFLFDSNVTNSVCIVVIKATIAQLRFSAQLSNQRQIIVAGFGFNDLQTTLIGCVDGVVESASVLLADHPLGKG